MVSEIHCDPRFLLEDLIKPVPQTSLPHPVIPPHPTKTFLIAEHLALCSVPLSSMSGCNIFNYMHSTKCTSSYLWYFRSQSFAKYTPVGFEYPPQDQPTQPNFASILVQFSPLPYYPDCILLPYPSTSQFKVRTPCITLPP